MLVDLKSIRSFQDGVNCYLSIGTRYGECESSHRAMGYTGELKLKETVELGKLPYYRYRNDDWRIRIKYNGHQFVSTSPFSSEGYYQCNINNIKVDEKDKVTSGDNWINLTIIPAGYNSNLPYQRLVQVLITGAAGPCYITLQEKSS